MITVTNGIHITGAIGELKPRVATVAGRPNRVGSIGLGDSAVYFTESAQVDELINALRHLRCMMSEEP